VTTNPPTFPGASLPHTAGWHDGPYRLYCYEWVIVRAAGRPNLTTSPEEMEDESATWAQREYQGRILDADIRHVLRGSGEHLMCYTEIRTPVMKAEFRYLNALECWARDHGLDEYITTVANSDADKELRGYANRKRGVV
jgi:hypothetical protein